VPLTKSRKAAKLKGERPGADKAGASAWPLDSKSKRQSGFIYDSLNGGFERHEAMDALHISG
jgi:hypothetical protein